MGPRDPKEVAKEVAKYVVHDLMEEASELRRTKADADHWLREDPEYEVLLQRLEDALVAVEAALVEARRKVRQNEERE
jgi:hypothetical protein